LITARGKRTRKRRSATKTIPTLDPNSIQELWAEKHQVMTKSQPDFAVFISPLIVKKHRGNIRRNLLARRREQSDGIADRSVNILLP
jgi:hypothetical protein